jgi:hypothetical protein
MAERITNCPVQVRDPVENLLGSISDDFFETKSGLNFGESNRGKAFPILQNRPPAACFLKMYQHLIACSALPITGRLSCWIN